MPKMLLAAVLGVSLASRPAPAQVAAPRPVDWDRLSGAMTGAQMVLDAARMTLQGMDFVPLGARAGLEVLGPVMMAERFGEAGERLERLAPHVELMQARLEAMAPQPETLGWRWQESVDSIYRRAREALNRGANADAATLFERVWRQYPRSPYAGDALYWDGWARYRLGGDTNLRAALASLERQARDYPQAASRSDGAALATRIRGELARRGDAEAAARVAADAERAATPPTAPRPSAAPRPPAAPAGAARARPGYSDQDVSQGCVREADDERIAALNALLHMDADRAMPVLRKVLERRDACSEILRRRAVFLVAQQKSPESANLLLQVARTDPDTEVKRQAVFWLGQVKDERAVDLLLELLRSSTDEGLQERAVFALAQNKTDRAAAALRAYADRTDVPDKTRERAIFWLGQSKAAENAAFLRSLYGRVQDEDLKNRVIQSLSQMRDQGNEKWLLGIAQSESEPIEARKKALFWAGQSKDLSVADLAGMYQKISSRKMKEQLIFVYANRKETAAVDELIAIARAETDSDLRKRAIFWLSHTKDPRVAAFLEELINQ